MRRLITILGLTLLMALATACNMIPGFTTPDDGPAIVPSDEAAASMEQKLQEAAAAGASGGEATVSLTQEEVTSFLALKVPATIDDGQGNTYSNPLQNPQVYFKADGTIVLRSNVTYESISQLMRVVASPSVVDGALVVDVTEGKIGPVPVPGDILNQTEGALAQAITAGQNYASLTSVTVAEGTITLVGTTAQ